MVDLEMMQQKINDISEVLANLTVDAPKRLLLPKEVAEMLNYTENQVKKKSRNRELPSYKFGKNIYFDRLELEDMILADKYRRQSNQEIDYQVSKAMSK